MRAVSLTRASPDHSRLLSSLSFNHTVDRALVHKRHISEVLLTSSVKVDERTFAVGAQWPRRHFHLQPHDRVIDSAIVAETLRQATIYVAHRFFGAPLGAVFLMDRMKFDRTSLDLVAADGPWEVSLIVEVDNVKKSRQALSSLTTSVLFRVGGSIQATGLGELRVIRSEVYERIRSRALYAPPEPTSSSNVPGHAKGGELLEKIEGSARWRLNIHENDPAYFEHSSDHVPGMLIMDAVRAGGRNCLQDPNAEMTYFDARFSRFLDLDLPIEFRIDDARADTRQVAASVWQGGEAAVRSTSRFGAFC